MNTRLSLVATIIISTSTLLLSCSKQIQLPTTKFKLRSLRSEIPMNMQAIKVAEISYYMEYDEYVAVDFYPSSPSKSPQNWVIPKSGEFKTIGWSPEGEVRGSYAVTLSEKDFEIIGLSDVDGDGVYATYVATSSTRPFPKTPANIY